jgi:hypothetical protein
MKPSTASFRPNGRIGASNTSLRTAVSDTRSPVPMPGHTTPVRFAAGAIERHGGALPHHSAVDNTPISSGDGLPHHADKRPGVSRRPATCAFVAVRQGRRESRRLEST